MKKLLSIGFIASLVFGAVPVLAAINYDDVTLSGGFQAGHFPQVWDLTACDLIVSFTYDANGLVDDLGAHAWAEFGVRAVGYGDFNPTWDVEGAGVWLATDYDWTANTFDPDPVGSPSLDLDDKLILQKAGGHGEGDYDLPSPPPNPWANHRVWFDRDGVDQWQAQNPLAFDGQTYNTGGIYNIVITLHATDATSGTASMTINDLDQGFETDGDWSTMELSPAGMTFTGDMTQMQVFYGLYGYGATHSVSFEDILVTGCLAVDIDIKPGSDPNCINNNGHGVIPVAILGSAGLDVTQIDPATVKLEGSEIKAVGKSNKLLAHIEDVNGDEINDLVVQIEDVDGMFCEGAATAEVTGSLYPEYGGIPIVGHDSICIVPADGKLAKPVSAQSSTWGRIKSLYK